MLQNLVNKAQYAFGAGLAGLGLYGIVESRHAPADAVVNYGGLYRGCWCKCNREDG